MADLTPDGSSGLSRGRARIRSRTTRDSDLPCRFNQLRRSSPTTPLGREWLRQAVCAANEIAPRKATASWSNRLDDLIVLNSFIEVDECCRRAGLDHRIGKIASSESLDCLH